MKAIELYSVIDAYFWANINYGLTSALESDSPKSLLNYIVSSETSSGNLHKTTFTKEYKDFHQNSFDVP